MSSPEQARYETLVRFAMDPGAEPAERLMAARRAVVREIRREVTQARSRWPEELLVALAQSLSADESGLVPAVISGWSTDEVHRLLLPLGTPLVAKLFKLPVPVAPSPVAPAPVPVEEPPTPVLVAAPALAPSVAYAGTPTPIFDEDEYYSSLYEGCGDYSEAAAPGDSEAPPPETPRRSAYRLNREDYLPQPGYTGLTDEQFVGLERIVSAAMAGVERTFTLAGSAGTGKTTLMADVMRTFKRLGRPVYLFAPTNQAAKRLRQVTGEAASTLHRGIYPKPEERDGRLVYSNPRLWSELDPTGIFVMDESSMLTDKQVGDFLGVIEAPPGFVLFVGDDGQLEPVEGRAGVPLATPDYQLTKIHRQAAGNPIIMLAQAIRNLRTTLKTYSDKTLYQMCQEASRGIPQVYGKTYPLRYQRDASYHTIASTVYNWHRKAEEFAAGNKALEAFKDHGDCVALVHTNEERRQVNKFYRDMRGWSPHILVPTEKLIVLTNHYNMDILNGDVVRVRSVEWFPTPTWLGATLGAYLGVVRLEGYPDNVVFYTSTFTFGQDKDKFYATLKVSRQLAEIRYNTTDGSKADLKKIQEIFNRLVHWDYAYAMTVHKFQGSQAPAVVVAWGREWFFSGDGARKPRKNQTDARADFWSLTKALYTAVTRAREEVLICEFGVGR